MAGIEKFISEVEAEVRVCLMSSIPLPDPDEERPIIERLAKKFPKHGTDVEMEIKILRLARTFFNARNN